MFQSSSVNVCNCTSISWYFSKIDELAFPKLEKKFSNDFALFSCKMRYQTALGLKIPLIYFRHSKVSWVKAYLISCLFIFTLIHPITRLKGLAVKRYTMKTIKLNWNTRPFIQQKITEKVGLYTNSFTELQSYSFKESWDFWKRNGQVVYHNTKVINGVFISYTGCRIKKVSTKNF